MPGGFAIRALDSVLRIEFAPTVEPGLVADVTEQWQDLVVDDGAPQQTITVGAGDRSATAGPRIPDDPPERVGSRVATRVTLTALERLRGRAILLHAAAIALDDGRVAGFIGPSGRGKTTAVAALARSHRYVTDETLAVMPDGRVIAYPKPLLIGRRPGPKRAHAASSLGLRATGTGPLRLAALVLLDRRPGFTTPAVTAVGTADAIVELAGQSSHLTGLDAPLTELARCIADTGGVRRVSYSEAETLPAALDEILALAVENQPGPTDARRAPVTREGGRAGGYRRVQHADAAVLDGRLLVLRQGAIAAVDGLAPVLWEAADDSTEDELIGAALRALPEPPAGTDPQAVVRATLDRLVEAGVLIRTVSE